MRQRYSRCASVAPNRQHGAALFVAIVALVAMTLAGLAAMRTVDTGAMVSGNIAFRKNATSAAERGLEEARAWQLSITTASDLEVNQLASGYYATWAGFDYRTYDWTSSSSKAKLLSTTDASGHTVRYVVHRLCSGTGPVDPATCVTRQDSNKDTKDPCQYGESNCKNAGSGVLVYYRVTSRVEGPRDTVTYVQTNFY